MGTTRVDSVERGSETKAALFMVVSALSFSIMQMAVKYTAKTVPVFEQVFFRNFVMLLISLVSLKIGHKPVYRDRKNLGILFLRGFFGMLGVVLYFYATKHLPSADAAILQKSSPFFVAIFSFFILGERLTKSEILAFLIAFAGAIFVTKPQWGKINLPSLAGLCSAIFAALAYVMIAALKGKEDSFTIMFAFSFVTTVCMLPFLLMHFYMPTFQEILGLCMIAITGAAGQYFLTRSYMSAAPGIVSIYNYTNVVFSALLGYFIFNDRIDAMSAIGITLIFSAAYYVYRVKMKVIAKH